VHLRVAGGPAVARQGVKQYEGADEGAPELYLFLCPCAGPSLVACHL